DFRACQRQLAADNPVFAWGGGFKRKCQWAYSSARLRLYDDGCRRRYARHVAKYAPAMISRQIYELWIAKRGAARATPKVSTDGNHAPFPAEIGEGARDVRARKKKEPSFATGSFKAGPVTLNHLTRIITN